MDKKLVDLTVGDIVEFALLYGATVLLIVAVALLITGIVRFWTWRRK